MKFVPPVIIKYLGEVPRVPVDHELVVLRNVLVTQGEQVLHKIFSDHLDTKLLKYVASFYLGKGKKKE